MNAIDTAGRTPYQHLLDSVQAHDMHPNRCYGGGQFTPDSRTADERWLQDLVNVADSRRYEVFRARVRAALAYPGATVELCHWAGVPYASVRYSDGSRRSVRVHPETGQPE